MNYSTSNICSVDNEFATNFIKFQLLICFKQKFRDSVFQFYINTVIPFVYFQHNARGTLSMANSGPNTNGSQFFISYAKQPHLNGLYTVFGKVIHGFEVLDLMEKVCCPCANTFSFSYYKFGAIDQ